METVLAQCTKPSLLKLVKIFTTLEHSEKNLTHYQLGFIKLELEAA